MGTLVLFPVTRLRVYARLGATGCRAGASTRGCHIQVTAMR